MSTPKPRRPAAAAQWLAAGEPLSEFVRRCPTAGRTGCIPADPDRAVRFLRGRGNKVAATLTSGGIAAACFCHVWGDRCRIMNVAAAARAAAALREAVEFLVAELTAAGVRRFGMPVDPARSDMKQVKAAFAAFTYYPQTRLERNEHGGANWMAPAVRIRCPARFVLTIA